MREQTFAGPTPRPPPPKSKEQPLRGFYDFVRSHLAVFNGLVLTAGSIVGAWNFFAPGARAVPLLLYSAVAVAAALMLLAGLAPGIACRALGRMKPLEASPAGGACPDVVRQDSTRLAREQRHRRPIRPARHAGVALTAGRRRRTLTPRRRALAGAL